MAWALLMYLGNYWAFNHVDSTQQRVDVIAYYVPASEDELYTMKILCSDKSFFGNFDVACLKDSGFNLDYIDGENVLLKKQHSMQYLALEVFLIPVSSLCFLFLLIGLFNVVSHRKQRL